MPRMLIRTSCTQATSQYVTLYDIQRSCIRLVVSVGCTGVTLYVEPIYFLGSDLGSRRSSRGGYGDPEKRQTNRPKATDPKHRHELKPFDAVRCVVPALYWEGMARSCSSSDLSIVLFFRESLQRRGGGTLRAFGRDMGRESEAGREGIIC